MSCVDSLCDDRLVDVSATSVEKRECSNLNPGSDQLGGRVLKPSRSVVSSLWILLLTFLWDSGFANPPFVYTSI